MQPALHTRGLHQGPARFPVPAQDARQRIYASAMTSSAQIVITFFGGGVAGAVLNAALGWTTQRRQARAQAVKAIAMTAAAWREGDEAYAQARAETLATALLAGIDNKHISAFISVAEKLHHIQSRVNAGRLMPGPNDAEVRRLETELYARLEGIRRVLWHPWRSAIASWLGRSRAGLAALMRPSK